MATKKSIARAAKALQDKTNDSGIGVDNPLFIETSSSINNKNDVFKNLFGEPDTTLNVLNGKDSSTDLFVSGSSKENPNSSNNNNSSNEEDDSGFLDSSDIKYNLKEQALYASSSSALGTNNTVPISSS